MQEAAVAGSKTGIPWKRAITAGVLAQILVYVVFFGAFITLTAVMLSNALGVVVGLVVTYVFRLPNDG